MALSTAVIINPAAGSGKTRKRLKGLIKEIHAHEKSARIFLTHHPLHATSLSQEALAQGASRLLVVGGDGTLNEVVNGCFDKDGAPLNRHMTLAMIPSGTGSDFVRSMEQGEEKNAIKRALFDKGKATDVGLAKAHDAQGRPVSRYFLNVASLGLSGLVAGFMETVTKSFGGRIAYFLATVEAIRALKPPSISLTIDGQERILENCSLVSFANGQYFGSGMKIAPEAKLDDGQLDIIAIRDLSALFFLQNGYRVYQGSHIELENVSCFRKNSCEVKALSPDAIYIETDGELFAQLPAQFSIKQQALLVVR